MLSTGTPRAVQTHDSALHIVGVGASAGGLEALEQLFSDMPPDTGLAFVVVQHLSPDFKSIMDELLSRRTRLPVCLVEDGVMVEANHIYLIPPKKEMIISGGRLLLSDKGTSADLMLPIDIFFRSLAQDCGHRAIAVVLSGGGSDGSRGIRDIHEAGGLVICQDEASAAFDGMPRSALDTGVVDHVGPPAQMARVLAHHISQTRGGVPLEAGWPGSPAPAHGVAALFQLLQREYGLDFSYYKPNTVVRRIDRRIQLARTPDLNGYVERLRSDPAELDALYRDLLIGVTRFFRDGEAFDYLEKIIIPKLLDGTSDGDELRVWVPGCATGEEAYSIAILLHEQIEARGEHRRVKMYATDVHSGSLEFASRALYSAESIARVSPPRLERYFHLQGSNGQVTPELRQLVVFARHNVMKDAPFTRLDLVSCRNMLIYFQPPAQKKVLSLFHFALKRDGILLLGPSESTGTLGEDFETLNKHWRVYKKKRDRKLAIDHRLHPPRSPELRALSSASSGVSSHYPLTQTIGIYDALLDEHMPMSMLVNDRRELIHTFGGAAGFVKVKDGRPSLDLFDLVQADLKMALTGALPRAIKERTAIVYRGLKLSVDGEDRSFKLTVKPIDARNSTTGHLLICLEPMDEPEREPAPETELDIGEVSRGQLAALEAELRYTKENLQATIEELETSNEELQSTNEEMLASNEELQSTNEELQSVNEELYTVNAEYQKKIAQLLELSNDIDNLLLSTDVGTIFLDRELCIRKFTPRVAATFHLLPQDVGRPISGFTNTLRHATLAEDLEQVLETERPIAREVRDRSGSWFYLRILPYRARGTTEGVVLTLIDIDGLKAAEDALFRERYLLDSLMASVPDAIYFKDASGCFVRINQAMADLMGIAAPELAVGKRTADFLDDAHAQRFDEPDRRVFEGAPQPYRLEQHMTPAGHNAWFMSTRQPLRNQAGRIVGVCGVARDVTEQKQADDDIRLAVARRDEFLAMLSHELRNPLGAIVCAASLLLERGGATAAARELEIIERQSTQMTRLLDDLLEANRVTQNKIELARRTFDVRDVVEDAVGALQRAIEQRKVVLDVDLDEEPVVIHGDPARLQQILVNLLGNAIKYTADGGRVWLSVKNEGSDAKVVVRDDGAGIEPAMLSSIFDMFVQGGATLARTEGGMGVGLTLVRALVERHGGTVTAKSDGVGCGSEFTVRIPAAAAELEETVATTEPVLWRPGGTVAVIDDNVDSCLLLKELLSYAGYEVHCAHDGEAGLEMIGRIAPDMAIVDIGLPKMDGYALAGKVREQERFKDLYLIALTGYGRPSDRAAAAAAGFDEHVVKPLQPSQIDRLIRRRRAETGSSTRAAHREA